MGQAGGSQVLRGRLAGAADLVGLARLVSGRSERPGFETPQAAPEGSRLTIEQAVGLSCDATAGLTLLSADPATTEPGELDHIRVLGTAPAPF